MEEESIVLKIVLLGEGTVGKTSIILRGQDPASPLPDLLNRTLFLGSYCHRVCTKEIQVVLNLIDTVGTEKFRSTNPSLFPNTKTGVLVFDITQKKSLDELSYWHSQLREYCPDIPIIVVGNKSDLPSHISKRRIEKVMRSLGLSIYIETSALMNINISELYEKIAQAAYEYSLRVEIRPPKTHFKISQIEQKAKQKKCCEN